MLDKKAMLGAASGYIKEHPEELLRAVRNAAGLRVGLPLAALRWLAGQVKGKRAPKDIELEAVPPGIRASATVNAMGTPLRVSSIIYIESVNIDASEMRFEIRLAEVSAKPVDPKSDSPIVGLLTSGSLDLSKPGNLVGFLPKRPPVLVDAKDDRIVIDLRKHPKLQNGKFERIVTAIAPLLTVRAITTDPEHLDVALGAFPQGVGEAVTALRNAL